MSALLTMQSLTGGYGETNILNQVSMTVNDREIVVIVGPNGAGKSTLLSMISRLLPMDAGAVLIDGLDVSRASSKVLARRLAILRQDNHLPLRLTVRDLVAFGRFPHKGVSTAEEDERQISMALRYMDMETLAHRFLDELSGGQRQRAFVAMVLCQDTDYVLLDEPLNGLDMQHAVAMMRTLRHAADTLGKTVVLVLHDINFASCYADAIIAMRRGRLAHHGSPAELVRSDLLSELYETPIIVHDIGGQRICVYYTGQPQP